MVNQLKKQTATANITNQVTDCGISIVEIENRYLWSIQADRGHDLLTISRAVFVDSLQFGKMLSIDSLRLIHLWPHKAYLLSTESSLPEPLLEFGSMLTDIGHGLCELSLSGSNALRFLGSYTSADLMDRHFADTRNLRCLLGHYPIILWWDDTSDIRILIDRSYAQSFCEYLEQLKLRWDQKTI